MNARIAALDRLLEVVVLFNDDMERTLGAEGLSQSRATVLWYLADGPLTQAALAARLQVTPRNVTGLVDGLVETKFVTREPHPTDRRATLVRLTRKGESTVGGMQRDQVTLADLLFEELGDRQLSALQKGLDHVAAKLREELGR